MGAELIPLTGLEDRELERWHRLAAEVGEPNPFFEPDFVLPVATALGVEGVGLLVAREAGTGSWLGCLPVHRVRRWRGVPLPALASWTHLYCFLGTPLLAGGRERKALEGMLGEGLRQERPALLGLSLLGTEGPAFAALRAAAEGLGLRLIGYEGDERAALRRREDPSGYIAIRPKHRRGFERVRRRLAEELGCQPETVDRSGDAEAVEEFLRLEAAGWKGRKGTAFASMDGHADFFRKICRSFRRQGRLQLLSLECGGRSLAMACNLRAGATIYCFKIAFDEGYGRFSPGIQLELDKALIFHGTDAELIDSCAMPGNEMINRLWADRVGIGAVVLARGARGALAAPVVNAAGALRRRRRGAHAGPQGP